MVTFDEEFPPITGAATGMDETPSTQEKSSQSGLDDHQKAILSTYDKIGKFDLRRLETEVLPCGLETLDKHKVFTKNQGRMITVGAMTSHGKTALLMQIAAYISKSEPVVVHSFEMGSDELEARLLAAVTNIPTNLISEGSVLAKKVDAAREDYAARKLYVSNVQNRSLNFVLSSIFELSKIIGKPGLVVIDYGQQIKPGGNGIRDQRVTEITDISAGLLSLAQQLKCNVLVGAQLNNEPLRRAYGSQDKDGRRDYTPIISDVREGSSIAHDSAAVLMIMRPYVLDRKSDKNEAHFYCVKHRHGELWDSKMRWDGQRCMFLEDSASSKQKEYPGL